MNILGIETSCDETGIAVIEIASKTKNLISIQANVVASQIETHRQYGGVYPLVAKREHEKNLPIVLARALREARLSPSDPKIDAVAIIKGPGLSPCLWTGVNFAKDLAVRWQTPLVPVNHIEGHILTALLARRGARYQLQTNGFPAIALIVSGGHTQIILARHIGSYRVIGETRDDAAGECFDKTARILGLPYPGGPAIAELAAKKIRPYAFPIALPRPMAHSKDFDFSFSGLKTAVLYDFQGRSPKDRVSKEYIAAMAREIQQAIVDVLVAKTIKAAERHGVKSIILGGGVAANKELRRQLNDAVKKEGHLRFFAPPDGLATDNGVMAALAGFVRFEMKEYINPKHLRRAGARIEAAPDLRIQ